MEDIGRLTDHEPGVKPKVFISYSWSSQGHQARIREWGEHLLSDGVDVVLDVWDLKEGDDKYAFMERMVTDESVSHVLMFCDSDYARKADARKSGVGTESQIISQEVYTKARQSKFIPIVCEFSENGEPCTPAFLKSRIWIDFSSLESTNSNWEKLIRILYGKPVYEKPTLGRPPSYLSANSAVSASPAIGKYAALRQAILESRPSLRLCRRAFLESCYDCADALRIRQLPDINNFGERVLLDCTKLKIVRNHIVDWVLLESEVNPTQEFGEVLIDMLEKLLDLKSRPQELNEWNDEWFEAHRVFVYESFLYIIASLMSTGNYRTLSLIFQIQYLLPKTDDNGSENFQDFSAFWGYSKALQILSPEGKRLLAPAAELIKRQADRTDITFELVIQAELLVLMVAFIKESASWYPHTLLYAPNRKNFPFFIRAAQHRNFVKLAEITGVTDADALRESVRKGQERLRVSAWHDFPFLARQFWSFMNMDNLDTVR